MTETVTHGAGTDWEQEIRALEEANRVAFLNADLATLERLWAEGFMVNSPLEQVHGKQRVLELLGSGRIRHRAMEIDIEHISRYGDVVVVMGRDRVLEPPAGIVSHRRFTNVWRLDASGWKTIARHAHVVAQEPAREEGR